MSSTLRTDAQDLRTREPVERGIMWVAPRQWFLPFGASKIVMGRGDDCDAVLQGAEISRYHASVAPEGGVMRVEDMGSTNGTHHQGQRIQSAILGKQDVIRLGEWVGVVCTIPRGSAPGVERVGGMYAGAALKTLLDYASKVAPSDIPLILNGESGSGKEMLARYVHETSGRSGHFVAVNCAALPESLAEAELFGHLKGAFTGAEKARSGYLRAADNGTLLLDEISDLPMAIQAKLLRVLEDSAVTPLGASRPVPVNLRVIAAGQKNLADLVQRGDFRGDLFARLNGLELVLPPLRQRREEVPYIFGAVLREQSPNYAPLLQPRLVERLCLHDWPFNVRELVQVTRRIAALFPNHSALREECLPPSMFPALSPESNVGSAVMAPAPLSPSGPPSPADRETIPSPAAMIEAKNLEQLNQAYRQQELEALQVALRDHQGNVSDVAKALGISRQKVYRLIEAHPELDPGTYRKRG